MLCIVTGKLVTDLMDKQIVLVEAGVSESTRSTRRSQLKRYKELCKKVKLSPFPCSSFQCRLYATFLSTLVKPISVRNYISAVWYKSKFLGYADFYFLFFCKTIIKWH